MTQTDVADWFRALPGESVLCRSIQSPKGAMIMAGCLAVLLLIGLPLYAVLRDLIFESGSSPRSLVQSVTVTFLIAIAFAASYFFFVYRRLDLIITDRRLICRRGVVFRRVTESLLNDIVEISPDLRVKPGAPFRLRKADGRSLAIAGLDDLDRLRQVLVRQTGLPDLMSGQ